MSRTLLPRRNLRTLTVGACALILVWLVVSRSLAAYLADVAPRAALRLDGRQPEALVNIADGMLNGAVAAASLPADADDRKPAPPAPAGSHAAAANRAFSAFDVIAQQSSVDLAAVRAAAESSLVNGPLDARAVRVLGQAADAAGDDAAASKFMQAAMRLSLHDPIAVSWLLIKSAEAKDYPAMLRYADIVLRTMPELGGYVVPILARIAEAKDAGDLFKAALIGNPPWRGTVLESLPRYVKDERVPLELMLALRQTPHPPTVDDVNHYLNFLVLHRLYGLAYYTWLQFLPLDQLRNTGLLYNGSFEIAPSGSPFDWRMTEGAGVTADIEPRPDEPGGHALVVNFEYGRVEYRSIAQLIMLTPGPYHFSGEYKGELLGPRGLKWRVACAENPDQPFAEGPMINGRAAAWTDTTLDFTVPAQNCRAQYLSLDLDSRMPSEQFVTGAIWFDDLKIARLATASTP